MKQAEITFKNHGKDVEIVGFKNVLTFPEIVEAIGTELAWDVYINGECFYFVKRGDFVRYGYGTENVSMTFRIGSILTVEEAGELVILMRKAGERLSELLKKENPDTLTVKI